MSSFIEDKVVQEGLTFDDVLLIPAYSQVLPREVTLTTKFSRNIELQIPFVTAAMDTVTEAPMAIAIAREGGIGVIHKNMSIEDQARQVAIVKRAENGMIYDPVTIKRGSTVKDALAIMQEYHIGGIPVVDDVNTLVGIVTNRDLRFQTDLTNATTAATAVRTAIAEMNPGNLPTFVLGYLGVSDGKTPYSRIIAKYNDCYTKAPVVSAEYGTVNNFDLAANHSSDRYDFVFASRNITVLAYGQLQYSYFTQESDGTNKRRLPSTHFPVMAKVKLP